MHRLFLGKFFLKGTMKLALSTRTLLLIVLEISLLLLSACSPSSKTGSEFKLDGAWTLSQVKYPLNDNVYHYPSNGITYCHIYEGDSIFYECQMKSLYPGDNEKVKAAQDVAIIPAGISSCTYIYKGGGETLYLENDNPHPLKIINDSTITIQQFGVVYTWIRATTIPESCVKEIRNIIDSYQKHPSDETSMYVLPTTERQLQAKAYTLTYVIIILVLLLSLIGLMYRNIYRKKRYIEQQLQQITEEQEQRPQPVRHAMKEVEDDFLNSAYYATLRKRIAAGDRLKKADWDEIEEKLKPVYPGFTNRLFSLSHMSELEYQVCLLIKLMASPSEMASVLSKDASTISSIRSRLYKKVFQKKGSSKDWDDFIKSL